jgi:hypothetical protein
MSHQPVIGGLEFARTGSKLQGVWPEELGRPTLRLRVDGALQFVYQRCLGALEYPLHIEVSLISRSRTWQSNRTRNHLPGAACTARTIP